MTKAKKIQTIPALPGLFFATFKDGELIDKFSTLELALVSIRKWPACEQHKALIRHGRYV
jgi:hypothetical protein